MLWLTSPIAFNVFDKLIIYEKILSTMTYKGKYLNFFLILAPEETEAYA